MMSPYWSHRNPQYFPDPETFNPVEFVAMILMYVTTGRIDGWIVIWIKENFFLDLLDLVEDATNVQEGRFPKPLIQSVFVLYRWFALMEINLYLALVLKMVDLSLLSPVPPPVCM